MFTEDFVYREEVSKLKALRAVQRRKARAARVQCGCRTRVSVRCTGGGHR